MSRVLRDRVNAARGLTIGQRLVLFALAFEADQTRGGRAELSVAEIASCSELSHRSVTRILGQLAAEGHISRDVGPPGGSVATRVHPIVRNNAPPRPVRRRIGRGLARQVFERDAYRCRSCGSHRSLHCDHIVPLSKGGLTSLENLQTLCGSCNSKKGAR